MVYQNRSFQVEVSGWHQNEVTDQNNFPIRSSGNVLITIPFSRFNQELQRINRLGGKVVNIKPLTLQIGEN
ncbi:phycobilisome linker polypeptide [Nostoc sp. CENA543]|uniref:phycobilisome linker polypeptide n=1 Tax=Nostoc sp. CENA543 TaxID=1869241 RepID=UPI000CA2304C|nr:phycobilisome linker polypeptide [Nostoc sp. CENA543]AUT02570.1 phycobilisome linker polypeptide [Nostoc sp. CENA543]